MVTTLAVLQTLLKRALQVGIAAVTILPSLFLIGKILGKIHRHADFVLVAREYLKTPIRELLKDPARPLRKENLRALFAGWGVWPELLS